MTPTQIITINLARTSINVIFFLALIFILVYYYSKIPIGDDSFERYIYVRTE